MKKVIIVCIIIICAFGLTACKTAEKVDYSQCVSYAHTHMFTGENDDFGAVVEVGRREKLFTADGKAEKVSDYALISVKPLKVDLADKEFSYELIGEGINVGGTLTRDVVTHDYTAETELTDAAPLKKIVIKYGEEESEIELTDKLIGMLTWKQALAAAVGELKTEIAANTSADGKLNREICVKFIRDKKNPDAPYYWYVSFIAEDGNYWALLIEPSTGKVVSRKV